MIEEQVWVIYCREENSSWQSAYLDSFILFLISISYCSMQLCTWTLRIGDVFQYYKIFFIIALAAASTVAAIIVTK